MKSSMEDWLNHFPPEKGEIKDRERILKEKKPRSGPGRKTLEKMEAQETLDIHGLSRSEAQEEIHRFLIFCRKRNIKRALIIHGKGKHSDGRAVLKPMVRKLLSENPDVAEFGRARNSEGGEGATWFSLAISPGR